MADVVGWRLVKEKHARAAFDGEGAKRFGGRWNSPGVPIVYCSENVALAALEILVHTQAVMPRDPLRAFRITWPASLMQQLELKNLPRGWDIFPADATSRAVGDEWVLSARSAVLALPSVIVPQERIFLINPRHREFGRIKTENTGRFTLDPRLR